MNINQVDTVGCEQSTAHNAVIAAYNVINGRVNSTKYRKANHKIFADAVAWLPEHLKRHIANEFCRRVLVSKSDMPLVHARRYLKQQTEQLARIWQKYPFKQLPDSLSVIRYRKSKSLIEAANKAANDALLQVQQSDDLFSAYTAAEWVCKTWMIKAPYQNEVKKQQLQHAAEWAILRMICPEWWLRKLSGLRDMCVEHMAISAGLVGKHSPYVSQNSHNEWLTQQKSAYEWLESTYIESDNGDVLPLIEAAMAGTANPNNKFVELVVRARGLQELAEDNGQVGLFITMTAPSKFHGNSAKWQENNPKQAQAYLVKQWSKIRAKFKRDDIEVTGVRVVEPHKDGTPHWHMVLFAFPQQVGAVKTILTKYAFEVDGTENGAKKYRLDVKPLDPQKGSAVGYIIKYISKNINGQFIKDGGDYEAETDAETGAKMAASWASRWKLRQFQFFGCSSVTLWREVRRVKGAIDHDAIAQAREAADRSCWADFEKTLRVNPLNLSYDETECGNQYGETVRRVAGIQANEHIALTREQAWTIKSMDKEQAETYKQVSKQRALFKKLNAELPAEQHKALPDWSFLKSSDSGATWTCGNNCTQAVKQQLRQIGITTNEAISLILSGSVVSDGDGTYWQIKDGQLMQVKYQ
ncbi:replication endonuclease [Shewanella marina]|uniref:replication endonuclease n=1 Tax=Shewanella marina TaxID=487319 RepID=UPI00047147D4|nr:replication endonuclease [Shewanella marina]